jgi:hypothetical protein
MPPPPSASVLAPGPRAFAERTTADAGYDAERLNTEFAGLIEAEGTLLDEIPERLDRFHYDLVATTTMHADEAQAFARGRVPVVAMLVGPGYVELVHEIAALPDGSRVGVVCASDRGAENIAETLAIAGRKSSWCRPRRQPDNWPSSTARRTSSSCPAGARGTWTKVQRPERLRPDVEFDPAGLELLRRAIAWSPPARTGEV